MEFGVGYFPTHDGVGPGTIARLVEVWEATIGDLTGR
jgi:hypothetical protein